MLSKLNSVRSNPIVKAGALVALNVAAVVAVQIVVKKIADKVIEEN